MNGARPSGAQRLAGALLLVWFLLPLVPLVLWAAADRWAFPAPLPTAIGASGLQRAATDGAPAALLQSLVLALAVAVVAVPTGAAAARVLPTAPRPVRLLGTALLFAPLALPPVAVLPGLEVLLLRLRIPPSAGIVLVLGAYALPYTVFTMRAAFAAVDPGHAEQARLLGASRAQVVLRVHLPLVAPALARAALLAFLVGWTDYLVVLLVGGGQVITLPLLVASAAAGVGGTSEVAVLSLAAIVPPVLLLVLVAGGLRRGVR